MSAKSSQPEPLTPVPSGQDQSPGGAFGRILVERGLATEAQIERCLAIQMDRAKKGDFVRLGAILVEEGLLTPAQVADVLQQQAITVLVCESCGAQYNVRRFTPIKAYECRRCHGKLVPPAAGKFQNVAVQDAVEADVPRAARPALIADQGGETVRVPVAETGTGRIRQRRALGRYEILGEIARGGMGVIYKARQLDLERVVALKTLRADEARRDDSMERFRREAQAIASLRHPNVVAVHDVGQIDDIPYFTMEFIEGLPLDRRILRGPMQPREALEILAPIAEAIQYCHGEGVVHRDLKPANIIIDAHGVPFLVDFGIAVRKSERGRDLDSKDELLGSIPYMAPEYVEGAAYDELCDVYSFGVVLYEVLSGHEVFPYYDRSTTRLLEKIVEGPPVSITERVPDLDADLGAIVMKAIAHDRTQRYPSAAELASDLRAWLRGEPVVANPISKVELWRRAVVKSAPPKIALVFAVTTILSASVAVTRETGRMILQHEIAVLKDEAGGARHERDLEIVKARLREAKTFEEVGRHERAVAVLNEVVDGYGARATELPPIAEILDLRGRLRMELGDPKGEEDLARAQRLDPRFGRRHR